MKSFKHITYSFGLLLAVLFWANGLFAQQQSDQYYLEAQVSSKTPLKTEQVTIRYKLRYKGNSINLRNPQFRHTPPDFGDHFEIVNEGQGRMEMDFTAITVYEYIYILQPKKTGTYEVPPYKLVFEGKVYESDPIKIKVLSSNAPTQLAANEKIFIDVSVSDPSPWKGEEVYVTYKLYSQLKYYNAPTNIPPSMEGFAATKLEPTSERRVEQINGQSFNTIELFKARLYPLRAGEITLDPYQFSVTADVPTGRIVRNWWGDRQEVRRQNINVVCRQAKINVRELPSGRPADFNGAVGSFDLESRLSDTQTETGEALTLSLTITGDGNLKHFEEPDLRLPPGFEAYEPQLRSTGSSKSYEYLLIPNRPGEFTLEPYSFSYFDTREEAYVTRTAEPFRISVAQGRGAATVGATGAGFSKDEVEMLGQDIRYISIEAPLLNARVVRFFGSIPFIIGLTTPLLLLLPLFLAGRRRREQVGDVEGMKQRRALKMAEKRLKEARKLSTSTDSKAFHNELIRALWSYLSDKFGIDQGVLSRDKIRAVLAEKGVSQSSIEGLVSLLDQGEMALYAPTIMGGLTESVDRAADIIAGIESEITTQKVS